MAVPATDDSSSVSNHLSRHATANSEEQTLLQQSSSSRATENSFLRRCCRWAFQIESWLSVALVLQAMVGTARLLTPRPLVAIANFFLAFLGFNPTHSPAVLRLFFLSFFSLIVGLSDLFWLVVKFTGPFGSAWLNPEYYWRPLYPTLYENVYVATAAQDATSKGTGPVSIAEDSLPGGGDRMHGGNAGKTTPTQNTKLVPLSRIFPPEKPPALWRIYVELVCLCVNPLLCLATSWLAWTLYKRLMSQMHAAEISYFTPAERLDYGSATADPGGGRSYEEGGGAESHIAVRMGSVNMPVHQNGSALLPHSSGPPAFVPFAGEGRRLGGEMPRTNSENTDERVRDHVPTHL